MILFLFPPSPSLMPLCLSAPAGLISSLLPPKPRRWYPSHQTLCRGHPWAPTQPLGSSCGWHRANRKGPDKDRRRYREDQDGHRTDQALAACPTPGPLPALRGVCSRARPDCWASRPTLYPPGRGLLCPILTSFDSQLLILVCRVLEFSA